MLLRPARLALHGAAVTVLAGSAVLLTGGAGHADGATRPDSYGGESTASSVHVTADRDPQPTPVTDLFHAEIPFATTSLDSSGSASARATALYPGAGLLGVPGLLCQAGACLPIPTDYPLMATASYPTSRDATAQTSPGTIEQDPLSVEPGLTVAHADPNRVEASARAVGVGVSGVVRADQVFSHSKQAFEGATLVTTADSTILGLDLGGGQLHIDKLFSVATARVNGSDVTTSSATTTVSGATAGGVPVTIDSTGIHVAGNGDGGALQTQVNTALAALDASGIQVRMLQDTKQAKDHAASAATGGLLVTFAQTVSLPAVPIPPNPIPGGPPNPNGTYVGSVTVGGAGVTSFAVPADLETLPPIELPGGVEVPVVQAPGTVVAPPVGPVVQQPAPTTSGPTLAVPHPRRAAVLGVDLTNERLRLLMLLLLGYPVLVLLSAPLRAPARLPRGR
jgi:hypothetical protein